VVRSGPKTHLEIQVPEDLTEWVQSPAGLAELEDIRAKTCALPCAPWYTGHSVLVV
jgi:hypothetical protein